MIIVGGAKIGMVVRVVVISKRKEKEFLGIKEKMPWMIGRR